MLADLIKSLLVRYRALLPLGIAAAVLVCATALAMEFDSVRVQKVAHERYGSRGAQAVSSWMAMMSQYRAKPESQMLSVVNEFWNSTVRGSEDSIIWKQTDFWATPLETLGKLAGDCEDFVIGKYFSLVNMGVPAEKLRFIYVRARVGGIGSSQSIAHMVLGYYATPTAEPLVLDSLTSSIAPASQRRDLTPVFSFNAQGIYVAGAAPASVDRISRWRTLLERMREQGFRP